MTFPAFQLSWGCISRFLLTVWLDLDLLGHQGYFCSCRVVSLKILKYKVSSLQRGSVSSPAFWGDPSSSLTSRGYPSSSPASRGDPSSSLASRGDSRTSLASRGDLASSPPAWLSSCPFYCPSSGQCSSAAPAPRPSTWDLLLCLHPAPRPFIWGPRLHPSIPRPLAPVTQSPVLITWLPFPSAHLPPLP